MEFISKIDGIFYAHNGGKFDYHFLLDYLEPHTPIMLIHGRLAKFRIGRAEFRDSMSILPIALAQYKKDDFDYSLMEKELRDLPENRERIRAYLKNDCVYLHELVTKFRNQYGGHLTLASSSMAAWEKMRGIKVPDSGNHFYTHFRAFYYGGRVECRERGILKGEFHLADINSAYPYAMLQQHPFDIGYSHPSHGIVGHGFYIVRARANGCFPWRDEVERSLSFPADNEMRNWPITGWELLAALELNLLRDYEILERTEFAETINFNDYILHHYKSKRDAKDKGDKASELFHKLMLNSLYGKFGANPTNYKTRQIAEPDFVDDDRYQLEGYLGEGKWAVVKDTKSISKSKFYNVATAASITGFERSYLLRSLIQCADTPLYMDTDCILARSFNNLDYGKELGQWDNQGLYTEIALGGKKLYGFKGPDGIKLASKGARLTYDEIARVAKGESVQYSADAPTFSLYRGVDFLERNVTLT